MPGCDGTGSPQLCSIRRTILALSAAPAPPQALEMLADATTGLVTAEDRLKCEPDFTELDNLEIWLALIESRLVAVSRMTRAGDAAFLPSDRVSEQSAR